MEVVVVVVVTIMCLTSYQSRSGVNTEYPTSILLLELVFQYVLLVILKYFRDVNDLPEIKKIGRDERCLENLLEPTNNTFNDR